MERSAFALLSFLCFNDLRVQPFGVTKMPLCLNLKKIEQWKQNQQLRCNVLRTTSTHHILLVNNDPQLPARISTAELPNLKPGDQFDAQYVASAGDYLLVCPNKPVSVKGFVAPSNRVLFELDQREGLEVTAQVRIELSSKIDDKVDLANALQSKLEKTWSVLAPKWSLPGEMPLDEAQIIARFSINTDGQPINIDIDEHPQCNRHFTRLRLLDRAVRLCIQESAPFQDYMQLLSPGLTIRADFNFALPLGKRILTQYLIPPEVRLACESLNLEPQTLTRDKLDHALKTERLRFPHISMLKKAERTLIDWLAHDCPSTNLESFDVNNL